MDIVVRNEAALSALAARGLELVARASKGKSSSIAKGAKKAKVSKGAIAGIIIAAIIIIIILLLAFWFMRRRKQKQLTAGRGHGA